MHVALRFRNNIVVGQLLIKIKNDVPYQVGAFEV